ncbi:MAG TPA: alpha/beta hydrolase [Candidatus Dormibacteraeota bacterium]|nr:alpha/beta hydrolase [Candidatus Dormibacteraeota bacterium]
MPLHEINGQWLHYEDTGGKLGPVVLAHEVLMDRQMFAPQIAARNSGLRIITWDARCHGETETTDDPFTYWDLAEDLRGLLDHLEIQRAVIGGAGQGGFVALRFALKYPQRVEALILLDTEAGAEDPRKVAMYEAMLDAWEADGLSDQLAEAIAAIILGNQWPGRHAWIAKWRQWPRSLLRPALEALVGREDIHDRLGEIKAPALVIHGTADAAIDIELAERLCSELANSQPLITVEGGGHASNLTHPKLVNLVVQQYLSKLALRTPRGAERRAGGRRSSVKRRFGERRNPVRAKTGRRVLFPFERRIAERRAHERRESWPGLGLWKPGAYS